MAEFKKMLTGVLLKADELSYGGMLDPADIMDTPTKKWWSQEKAAMRKKIEDADAAEARDIRAKEIVGTMSPQTINILKDQGYFNKKRARV